MIARAKGLAWLAAAVGLFGASCSPGGDEIPRRDADPGYFPPKAATLTVTMADYYFVYANRVPAGRVVFTVTNAAARPHRLSLFPLADSDPPLDTRLREPGASPPVPLQNMPVLGPGQRSSFAVDLVPGNRYAMASLWPGPDGVPDALLGMTSEFRAGGRAGP